MYMGKQDGEILMNFKVAKNPLKKKKHPPMKPQEKTMYYNTTYKLIVNAFK